jgi:hypothetical protein
MLALVPDEDDGGSGLEAVRAFAASLAHGSWFAACGDALTAGERDDAQAYLAALGMAGVPIEGVPSWEEARRLTQRSDWSQAWWEAEAAAQRVLQERGARRFGTACLLAALSQVAEAADALLGAASIAASRAGIADPSLTRVAAGSAAQACHHQALALALAVGSDHLFAVKYRLFAAGRWPLGVVGDRLYLF